MPSANRQVWIDRRYEEEVKGHCLPGSSTVGGTIVDDVVDHRDIGSDRRDYRTIREGGRNNKYKES